MKLTTKEICELERSSAFQHPWRNNKTAELYYVLRIAMDATNHREGHAIVVYSSILTSSVVYVRDYEEFMEKFSPYSEIDLEALISLKKLNFNKEKLR